jgi:hypothetical protein
VVTGSYIGQNLGQSPLCYAKNWKADGEMVNIDARTVDFATVPSEANFQHYFVEHGNSADPMHSIKTSCRPPCALS